MVGVSDAPWAKRVIGDQTAKTLSGVGSQRDEKNAGKASIFCMAVSRLI